MDLFSEVHVFYFLLENQAHVILMERKNLVTSVSVSISNLRF